MGRRRRRRRGSQPSRRRHAPGGRRPCSPRRTRGRPRAAPAFPIRERRWAAHGESAPRTRHETRRAQRDDRLMKTRVHELMRIGDALYSKRFPLLTLWQSFAENFYPIRADMTRARYISEEFASYLMTGRPVLAHRELANALSSILRPRGMQWFAPK